MSLRASDRIPLCSRCAERADDRGMLGHLHGGSVCSWCRGLATCLYASWVANPAQAASGAPWCHSTLSIVRSPEIVWDVNGYYRALGVPSSASRKQIGAAYQRLGGHHDVWLTMAVKVLLSDERQSYDSTPLGSLYVDDFLAEAVRNRVRSQIAEVRKALGDEAADELQKSVDLASDRVLHLHNDWSWWTWRSRRSDAGHLFVWRSQLLSELAKHGAGSVRLAVGWQAVHPQQAVLVEVEPGVIGVFAHESVHDLPRKQVTELVATQIAAHAAQHHQPINGG